MAWVFCPAFIVLLCSNYYFSLSFLLPVNVSTSFLIPLNYSFFYYKLACFCHSNGSLPFRLLILQAVECSLHWYKERKGDFCDVWFDQVAASSLPLEGWQVLIHCPWFCRGQMGVFVQLRNSVSHFSDSCAAQLRADGNGVWTFTTGCLLSFKGSSSHVMRGTWMKDLTMRNMCSTRPVGLTLKKGLLE